LGNAQITKNASKKKYINKNFFCKKCEKKIYIVNGKKKDKTL